MKNMYESKLNINVSPKYNKQIKINVLSPNVSLKNWKMNSILVAADCKSTCYSIPFHFHVNIFFIVSLCINKMHEFKMKTQHTDQNFLSDYSI
ncbi:hypothetical protein RDI58_000894 [Solanum bulbocastanum]|uniref:Uncharacterized protein n=1 Tax=Solanum bulbocastanum TaxID=147425 RepID=A0AAN8UBJ0_SOLBU